MTLMILCTYLTALGNAGGDRYCHLGISGDYPFWLNDFFVSRHLLPQQKEWQMIYPSWFVTFVGIGVIPVTSGKFVPALGQPLSGLHL